MFDWGSFHGRYEYVCPRLRETEGERERERERMCTKVRWRATRHNVIVLERTGLCNMS